MDDGACPPQTRRTRDPRLVRVQENRGPSDVESRAFFHELHSKTAPKREDISTWFDLLDVDDYVSFGGAA